MRVAGARWAVEGCFQAAKNEAGMDHYQVRRYESWYRYVTLAMLALAFLAVTRAALADDGAILASSANEIRRMFTALCGRRPTNSTPATGRDGATATRKPPATATTSDNDYKITKCGWNNSHLFPSS